jgi:alpha-tubulin suppressor-like RCC1 family protein
VTLPAGEQAVSIAVGAYFTCAATAAPSGRVYCWGANDVGQCGSAPGGMRFLMPTEVPGIGGSAGPAALGVTAREAHACAWMTDGTVKCWGQNPSGQLGDGTLDTNGTPVAVKGLTDAVQVSAGTDHTCAVRTGGKVSCWGSSYRGQVGNGITGTFVTPQKVLGL